MNHFYSHLIETDSISLELDGLGLSKVEKLHLAHLIDSSLHHTILDAILSQLKDHEKRAFMMHLRADNHDRIWKFLNEKADNIAIKIKKTAEDLKQELMRDLKKAKKLK